MLAALQQLLFVFSLIDREDVRISLRSIYDLLVATHKTYAPLDYYY